MWWAKEAREAYISIGEEYEATRRRPLPVADFATFGNKALDVGCGRGAQPRYLEHEHGFVVHCDLDRRMTPGGDSVECEATMMPFRDGAFDVVYLVAVIHHMPRDAAALALREARRVGRVAVATVWALEVWRGREIAPGVWEVPWGGKARRIYFQYRLEDLLAVAPTRVLSAGVMRRGRHYNFYIVF
ncbi:class I SAM-dependent methyltransferase [Pyrobaculum sp. 3827-6]|uniref:class I SAM-dependent methyltransferase n=1 Tax=Pyrobaculum sp. 3827-6 TaxID=2983604 RepID=UPI0021D8B09E|nr:class I SAM-dependent methyltransferase [Pyrobaculum sp. 3827-6]MCU7788010.1 class I SAM-dependent methyltransferase [Pyrobaculum sp. 3827-6]